MLLEVFDSITNCDVQLACLDAKVESEGGIRMADVDHVSDVVVAPCSFNIETMLKKGRQAHSC